MWVWVPCRVFVDPREHSLGRSRQKHEDIRPVHRNGEPLRGMSLIGSDTHQAFVIPLPPFFFLHRFPCLCSANRRSRLKTGSAPLTRQLRLWGQSRTPSMFRRLSLCGSSVCTSAKQKGEWHDRDTTAPGINLNTSTTTSNHVLTCVSALPDVRHCYRQPSMSRQTVKFEVDSLYNIVGKSYLVVGVQRWYSTGGGHYTTLVRINAKPGSQWLEYNDDIVEFVDSRRVCAVGEGLACSLLFRRVRNGDVPEFNAAEKEFKKKPMEGFRKSTRGSPAK